jgi:hypothetical protein
MKWSLFTKTENINCYSHVSQAPMFTIGVDDVVMTQSRVTIIQMYGHLRVVEVRKSNVLHYIF